MLDLSSYIITKDKTYPVKGDLYLISDYPVEPLIGLLNHSCRVYEFNRQDHHSDLVFDYYGYDEYSSDMFSGYDTYMIEVNRWVSYVDEGKAWLLTKGCNHIFPNNGLLLSWCKFCGKVGSFNRVSCKFEEV